MYILEVPSLLHRHEVYVWVCVYVCVLCIRGVHSTQYHVHNAYCEKNLIRKCD